MAKNNTTVKAAASWTDVAKTTGWLTAKAVRMANDWTKKLAIAGLQKTNNRLDKVQTTAPSSTAAAAARLLG
jgi:hypothetical protein